jgi:hypothetical protein
MVMLVAHVVMTGAFVSGNGADDALKVARDAAQQGLLLTIFDAVY